MKKLLAVMAATLVAGLVSVSVYAETITTGFGTIPGAPANAYSGSGIPINTSEWEVADLPNGDTITMAMAATQHGSGNPAPGNNGAGTYTVNPGLNAGRSTWNFDFYVSSLIGLANYNITITEENVATGQTFTFNPLLIPDNVPSGSTTMAGNSESLDFATFGVPISYNPNANDTYDFSLDMTLITSGGSPIGSDPSIAVIAGTGAPAVPDNGSTASLLAASFGGLIAIPRFFKRHQEKS